MVASSTKEPDTRSPAEPAPGTGKPAPGEPSLRERIGGTGFLVTLVVAVVGALLLLLALVAPKWLTDRSSSSAPGRSEPVRQAEEWVAANIGFDDHVVVDAAIGDDLLGRGISSERMVPIEATESSPDSLTSWRQYDYLVSSPALRARLGELPSVQDAIDSSRPVAAFGEGDERVEIRRILPGGMASVDQRESEAQDLRLRAGASLALNPNLTASTDAVDELKAGQVDERLLNVIATLVVQHHLEIGAFPVVEGEDGIGAPRRIVEIDGIDFQTIAPGTPAVASLEAFLDSQLSSYRPVDVAVETHPSGSTSLRITYSVADPNP